ncbi:Uncharacterised protein [Weeksella virosa]|uniref:hypothetical protein n=1 Tax=Weeksella virosa TaxID=1014 RepID=UPI000E08A840|nr:hypothetical protein [Weeksella virosa]SUP53868.1 Uncharacterised protein [Weeksella virosa]
MEESLEQKKRRLFGKQYLDEYQEIIEKITNNDFKILSIVETDKLIEKESKLKLRFSKKILFNDKEELKRITFNNFNAKDSVYIFTSLSRDCGAVLIDSINSFNFNFNFMDDHSGIISLISSDVKNKILLDFYEEDGLLYLEIESYQ